MGMDLADRKANEISDLLYTSGVRTDDDVHLTVYASADRNTVSVHVSPNSYDCAGCRARGLAKRALDAARQMVTPSTCTGCRKQDETNSVLQRRMLARVKSALTPHYTVTDEYAGHLVTYLHIAV